MWHMHHSAPSGPWSQAQVTQAVPPRQELLAYIPKPLQCQVNTASIKSLVSQELKQMQGCSSLRAQTDFVGRSM